MLRRVRGINGSMVVWAVPWTAAGLVLALILSLQSGYQYGRLAEVAGLRVWTEWVGGVLGFAALMFGIVGAANGALFALAVIALDRRRHLGDVPRWHLPLIGAVSSAGVAILVLRMPLLLCITAASLGALSGIVYQSAAMRGARLSAKSPDLALPDEASEEN
ncbi:MAG: hypothetical protein ABIW79_04740 [Gemmatimonas sp.]